MDTTNPGDVFKLERKLDAALQGPSRLVDLSALQGQNPFVGLSALQSPSLFTSLSVASSAYISAADAFERLKRSGVVADAWAAHNPMAGLVQQFAPASYLQGIDVKPYWPRFSLDYPLGQYMSAINTAEMVSASSWKPVLMRQSWMSEASFISRLAEIDRSHYFALRPELWSVVQRLSAQYEGVMQNVVGRWLGSTEVAFKFDFDTEDASIDESSEAALAEPQRILSPRTPVDNIDTTTDQRRLRTKLQRIVWVAGRPYAVLRVASAGTSALIGWNIGEVAGNAGLGAVIAPVAHEIIVVLLESRRKS